MAKMASATSSSTSVNPAALWRDISAQPGDHAIRRPGLRHREIDLADAGIGRLAHRLLDGEREVAFARLQARGRDGWKELARAQLRHAVFRGPRGEEPQPR